MRIPGVWGNGALRVEIAIAEDAKKCFVERCNYSESGKISQNTKPSDQKSSSFKEYASKIIDVFRAYDPNPGWDATLRKLLEPVKEKMLELQAVENYKKEQASTPYQQLETNMHNADDKWIGGREHDGTPIEFKGNDPKEDGGSETTAVA